MPFSFSHDTQWDIFVSMVILNNLFLLFWYTGKCKCYKQGFNRHTFTLFSPFSSWNNRKFQSIYIGVPHNCIKWAVSKNKMCLWNKNAPIPKIAKVTRKNIMIPVLSLEILMGYSKALALTVQKLLTKLMFQTEWQKVMPPIFNIGAIKSNSWWKCIGNVLRTSSQVQTGSSTEQSPKFYLPVLPLSPMAS